MGLTSYIQNLGRAVAYYPNLRKITGSVTASILLCQLLYWSDKTRDDGWIWKTTDELEEETGLSKSEQRTAKATLQELGFIEFEFKRLDHKTRYRINPSVLNKAWDEANHGKSKQIVKNNIEKEEEKLLTTEEILKPVVEREQKTKKEAPKRKYNGREKKGDLVDGMIAFSQSAGLAKMQAKEKIRGEIETALFVNTDNSKWDKFIDFCYNMEINENKPVKVFLKWALQNGFDPIYWPPDKMKTLYPQAFKATNKKNEEFIRPEEPKANKPKEEDYVPMPTALKKKQFF